MNNQIKSAIILIDNLLNNISKYNKQTLSDRLEQEEFANSTSAITRLLQFIDLELDIKIKFNKIKNIFFIDYENSEPNYQERYNKYKNLYFRNILQKTALKQDVTNQYISFSFPTRNENVKFLNPFLTAILESKKIEITYLPFYKKNLQIIL